MKSKKEKEKETKLRFSKNISIVFGTIIVLTLFIIMCNAISNSAKEHEQVKSEAARQTALTYLDEAEELLKADDREGAIEKAELAIQESNDSDIQEKYDYYLSMRPYELYLYNNISNIDYDNPKFDDNCIIVSHNENQEGCICKLTYRLNGNYDIVTGIGTSLWYDDIEQNGYFIIIGDGKKLYTSPNFGKKVTEKSFSVNISNVEELVIEFHVDKFDGGGLSSLNYYTEFGVQDFVALKSK